jgi:hypothetical protein
MLKLVTFVLIASTTLVACKDEAPTSGAASASAGTAAASGKASTTPAAAKKEPTTKLTGKQLQEAYDAAYSGPHMMDPFDKKKATLVQKLGEPQKTDGDKLIWWGVSPPDGMMGEDCRELTASATGVSGLDSTDKSKCGL